MGLLNSYYKLVGLAFLALGKVKYQTSSYRRARPFSMANIQSCIDYDIKVVDEWLEALESYSGESAEQIRGSRVLELGPGMDFGVPLYLLSKGVAHYSAIDAFPLALRAPSDLHEAMLARINSIGTHVSIELLRGAIPRTSSTTSNGPSRLCYVVRQDFEISSAFEPSSFDYVFSQAAFEHFDDIDEVIRQLSLVARSGARLIAGVDFRTHARWIREKDPLNIYRYSEKVYRSLGFRTMPNRVLASEYESSLKAHGWNDIEMRNISVVDHEYFVRVRDSLNVEFRREEVKMLWMVVCATRE